MNETNLKRVCFLFFFSVLLLTVLLYAFSGPDLRFSIRETSYELYYVADYFETERSKDGLFASISHHLPDKIDEISCETLILAHMSQSNQEESLNPYPIGTQLIKVEHVFHGVADLYFSSEYGELSGVQRTSSDYAITLTLSQLPQITGIRIFVDTDVNQKGTPDILRVYDILVPSLVPDETQ